MRDAVPGVDYRFTDPSLLRVALTHKSHGPHNYERLEFLGDSVLGLVISSRLFELHPEASEGDLSRMRSRIVRAKTLVEVAQSIELGSHLNLGQGEIRSGGQSRFSILADALEAFLGAIYLDGGFEACRTVIVSLFDTNIRALPAAEELKDAKTRLQEWLQARGFPLPAYSLLNETGADHAKTFLVRCTLVEPELEFQATGSNRRNAEQAAAAGALRALLRVPAR